MSSLRLGFVGNGKQIEHNTVNESASRCCVIGLIQCDEFTYKSRYMRGPSANDISGREVQT